MADDRPPPPSPASKRAHRASAGSLLLAERASRVELQGHVNRAAMAVSGQASQHPKLTRAALLTLIVVGAKHLANVLTDGIKKARQRARDLASERLKAELKAGKLPKLAARVQGSAITAVDE